MAVVMKRPHTVQVKPCRSGWSEASRIVITQVPGPPLALSVGLAVEDEFVGG